MIGDDVLWTSWESFRDGLVKQLFVVRELPACIECGSATNRVNGLCHDCRRSLPIVLPTRKVKKRRSR